MTGPFRMTCQLKRKRLPWEYRQWKRALLLMWWSKPAVVFIVKRNAKSPGWYPRHQIRYISKFFSSLKDPVSLTLFKPSASHFFLFGTTLFLWELRSWKLLSMQYAKYWLRQKRFKKPDSIRPKLIQINWKILKQYCTTHCTKHEHLNRSKELTFEPF